MKFIEITIKDDINENNNMEMVYNNLEKRKRIINIKYKNYLYCILFKGELSALYGIINNLTD